MNFFEDNGFGLGEMMKFKIGPIVLWEKSYYFKEIHPGEEITIKLTNSGESENGHMLRLEQRIYNGAGENCFLAYTLVAFLDTKLRKMVKPPEILQDVIKILPKSDRYRMLAKSELRDTEAYPLQ